MRRWAAGMNCVERSIEASLVVDSICCLVLRSFLFERLLQSIFSLPQAPEVGRLLLIFLAPAFAIICLHQKSLCLLSIVIIGYHDSLA